MGFFSSLLKPITSLFGGGGSEVQTTSTQQSTQYINVTPQTTVTVPLTTEVNFDTTELSKTLEAIGVNLSESEKQSLALEAAGLVSGAEMGRAALALQSVQAGIEARRVQQEEQAQILALSLAEQGLSWVKVVGGFALLWLLMRGK